MTPLENIEIVERLRHVLMPKDIIANILQGKVYADRAQLMVNQAQKLMKHPKPFL